MDIVKLLFESDAGLASLAVIAFVVVMGAYLTLKFKRLQDQDPGKQGWD